MDEKIIILDFGSSTNQLIGRRIRGLNTYCEIVPYNKFPHGDDAVKGVVLSGSPYSVNDEEAFDIDLSEIRKRYPVLAIGYGAQYIAQLEGANVTQVDTSECGKAELSISAKDDLFEDMSRSSTVWMSHVETISDLPKNLQSIASIDNDNVAAYRIEGEPTWGVQFNPEVVDTEEGVKLFSNFLDICECKRDWTPASFVKSTVKKLKQELGDDKVILALSGGVDSSVAAVLLHRAIGENLTCVFVDH
ncbi:MAG: GMP synthase (glutamine-hydrolyzing), partial [Bacteroidales bacterium]|nr:GMP synthase (glutamine-hydrolyzing) [Bacteroidales bacterium]